MTSAFSMIFSLNIMIEVLRPLKILILLFFKINLSAKFSFVVLLLPLNSTDLQNDGTVKNMFFYNTIENISNSKLNSISVTHDQRQTYSSLAGCVNSNNCLNSYMLPFPFVKYETACFEIQSLFFFFFQSLI